MCQNGSFSPHHCVGFLFFAWIPPLLFPLPPRRFIPQLITPQPITAPLLITPLLIATHHSSLSCGRRSTQSFLAAFRVAGAVHTASWTSCGARGRRWPAAAFRVTHHTPLITAPLITFHSSHHSSLHHFSHLTHHTTRVAGAVHRASWPAAAPLITTPLLTSHSSHHACGRCSTQSFLARGCLSCGRPSTQSFLAAFRVAGAIHRASWTSCSARGRRWPAAACRVTHHTPLITAPCTYHISLIAPLVWLAQYTEPPGGAASCGRRSTQSPGRCWPAAAFHGTRPPLARGCLSCGRRSTHSFLDKLRRAWPLLARGCLRVTHHTPLITAPLFTSHSSRSHSSLHHCSHLTHDTTRVAGAV